MSTFAIKVYEFGVGDQFYIGKDERLWDWLNADDVLIGIRSWDTPPPIEGESLRVLTPVGFVFYDDMLIPWDSDVAMYPPEPLLSDWNYVSADRPDIDKAHMLILSPYDYVISIDEKEFKSLDIGEDRVFEITV